MKRSEPQSIEQILRQAIAASNLSENFDRQRASALWAETVGPEIASRTTRRYVDGSVLHVFISSAALKNELMFHRSRLVRLLNEAVGAEALTDICIH